MDHHHTNAELPCMSCVAIELFYLRETARAAGEEFLAFLVGLAAKEAERLGAQPTGVGSEELPAERATA